MAKQIAEMSVEELEKKYKVKAKEGTISTVGGKYYLTVDGEKRELKPDQIISSLPLEKILERGAEVRVIFSPKENVPMMFHFKVPPYHPVMCYIWLPRPVLIDIDIRKRLVKKLAKEHKLPDALAKQLINDIAAEARK